MNQTAAGRSFQRNQVNARSVLIERSGETLPSIPTFRLGRPMKPELTPNWFFS
jgi:hypothetical protein